MKSVLISIQPKWCELIASGKKTVDVRKTAPKLEPPFKCYIYCTKGNPKKAEDYLFVDYNRHLVFGEPHYKRCCNGKVIGEFICDRIEDCRDLTLTSTCLTLEQWCKYTDNHKGPVWGWHISDLAIYDQPKALDWLRKPVECQPVIGSDKCRDCYDCEIKRPPQSWCYVEGR